VSRKPDPLTVIVLDDRLAARRGIGLMLLGEAAGMASATQVDAARTVRAHRDPDTPIVLHADLAESDAGLTDAVRRGPRGYVLESSPAARLSEALDVVAHGGSYFDPALHALLTAAVSPSRPAMLTVREHEILGLLAEGLTGQAIAGRLFLSPETVRTHIRNAVTRLGARTRVQAVAMMLESQHTGARPKVRAHAA
jgi:DNA-binding NarL/FixJ family response regulator